MLLLFGAVSVGSWLVTRGMVRDQERDTLRERADEAAGSVAAVLSQARATFRSLGAAAQSDPVDGFRAAAAPFEASARTIVMIDTTGPEPVVVSAVGRGAATGDPVPDDVLPTIAAAGVGEPLTPTSVLDRDGTPHLGLAQGPPTAPPGRVLYLELPLSRFDPLAVSQVLGTASDVDVALYASPTAEDDQLLYATTRDLPLGHGAVTRQVPAGSARWALVAAPTAPLADPLARALPWLLLGGGITSALLATAVVEGALRRRDAAVAWARERAEESLSVLDAAQEAFVSIDRHGVVTRWSRQSELLFGWTADEAIGQRVSDLIIPPESQPAHHLGVQRYLSTGEGRMIGNRVEVEALHRDGHRLPVELLVWPVERDGSPGFNAIVHDISERRRAADELAAAHREAVEASRHKSEFLANMSHEIRTPMNGVIGMTALLLSTDLDPDQREYAETIRSSADSLLAVINDILDFSKIEAGKLELEQVDFDVRTTVDEVAELLAGRAHEKGLEMLVTVADEVPAVVVGDPGRVRQVLVNLVANAVKFTNVGEVVLAVDVASDEGDQAVLRFTVRDTGIGIPPEFLPRLFDSFSQADGSTTRRFGGSGLGLAIVRQLTTLMGGDVEVDSVVGKGSRFSVTVPVQVQAPARAPLVGPADLRGHRVLVVDDNRTNRTILSTLLAGWGMQAEEAEGASRALQQLREATAAGRPFTVALLDFHMPGIDGLDLGRRIVADTAIRPPTMLLLTSSGDLVNRDELAAAGIQAALAKPVRHQILHARIAEAVADGPPPRRAEVTASDRPATVPDAPAGPHVLVVEDNRVNQRVAVRMLERFGCTVDLAGNGREAVAALERARYDVVFMDCQMPELDGYEATAAIRHREGVTGRPRAPIVAMTAAAMAGDEQRALDAGMDDYLTKPVALDALGAALRRWAPAAEPSAGPTGDTGDVLDLRTVDQLLDLAGGAEGELEALLEVFARSARERLDELRAARAARDFAGAGTAAHALRGSSASLGASRLAEACAEVEEASRRGDAEGLDRAIEAVEARAREADLALHALLR